MVKILTIMFSLCVYGIERLRDQEEEKWRNKKLELKLMMVLKDWSQYELLKHEFLLFWPWGMYLGVYLARVLDLFWDKGLDFYLFDVIADYYGFHSLIIVIFGEETWIWRSKSTKVGVLDIQAWKTCTLAWLLFKLV